MLTGNLDSSEGGRGRHMGFFNSHCSAVCEKGLGGGAGIERVYVYIK